MKQAPAKGTVLTGPYWPEPVRVLSARRQDERVEIQAVGTQTERFFRGHEFITDVLELRFTGTLPPADNRDLWLSTLYTILAGASEALGIARDDLDGTIYPYTAGLPPALVLFDNIPGGAGHVRRIANALPRALDVAWDRVTYCECGEETSCHECLRNFYNQYYHDQLRRGLASDFLNTLIQQDPGFSPR